MLVLAALMCAMAGAPAQAQPAQEAAAPAAAPAASSAAATAATPAAKPAATPAPVTPPQMLRDPNFRSLYLRALGPLTHETWLTRLDGPAPPVRDVKVAGADYRLVAACKPHDCAAHNVALLYSPGRQLVYGRLQQAGRGTRLGAPPAHVARELDRLWRAEWRRGR